MMQDLVGIVRMEDEMQRALSGLEALKKRAEQVGVTGHREFNTGWHAAQDLGNLLMVSEVDRALRDRAQGEPRRAFPSGLSRTRTRVRDVQYRGEAWSRRRDAGLARADRADAGRVEAGDRGEQVVLAASFQLSAEAANACERLNSEGSC